LAAFHGAVAFAAHTRRPAIFVEFHHKAKEAMVPQTNCSDRACILGNGEAQIPAHGVR
jgi:hypothetical protein